ncbi:hypothetical protein [Aeromicrobium sp. 179-A 4D2 NHS]|uniref:hypothetical protein n=1 Tax=Aeromicrobium sp. 179-A 4D2 NHS TaxID=3142375 RepID=UPI0039A04A75
MSISVDFADPRWSYILGLLQTDGHHQSGGGQKGKITLELNSRDRQVLEDISDFLPCNSSVLDRTRDTQFKVDYTSSTLAFSSLEMRKLFAEVGLLVGRKSKSIAPPSVPISTPDYVRGLLDGDGSIGFTAKRSPFIGFVTDSEPMVRFYCDVIESVTGRVRRPGRNTRDSVFNVLLKNQAAFDLARWAWYPGHELAIPRKAAAAQSIFKFDAEVGIAATYFRKTWSDEEDAIVLSNPVRRAAELLERTIKSVGARRHRLITAGRTVAYDLNYEATTNGATE